METPDETYQPISKRDYCSGGMSKVSEIFDGCYAVTNELIHDARGTFVKTFQSGEFVDRKFDLEKPEEIFHTQSHRGIIRGLHLQAPPHAVSKFVLCTEGTILDFVLDLRTDSTTYLQISSVVLGIDNDCSRALFVPRGIAHGFFTLTESATVVYLQSGKFSPEHDTGVSFHSVKGMIPELPNFDLSCLSLRDQDLPSLEEFPRYSTAEWQQA